MDDIEQQIMHRDHFRRAMAQRKTPAQRMCDVAKLQDQMWATFRRSPAGYAHFLRRNFKARAITPPDSNGR